MRGNELLRRLGLILAASLLVGAVFAGTASARTKQHFATHHYTKAQKIAVRHQLARAVKRNPRVVLKTWFLKKAGSVSYTLPVTLRFRKSDLGQDPTLNLDLGSLGVKTLTLQGSLQAQATFVDPAASGVLGELRVTIPAVAPGTAGGGSPTASLRATPLAILTNPDVTGKTIAQGGCSDFGSVSQGTAISPSPSGPFSDPITPGAADPNLTGNNPAGVDATSVFRTPFLPIGVASQVVQPPNNLSSPSAFTGVSGGTAYLFGNPAGPSAPTVDVTLNALTPINSILRDVATENPLFVGLGQQCRQTWTGFVNNVLTAHVSGSIAIRPDVTADGRLRLAVATLTGGSTPNVVSACDAPYSQFAGVTVPGGTKVDITGLPGVPLGVTTAQLSADIAAGSGAAAPGVPCGTAPVMGGAIGLFAGPFPGSTGPVGGLPGVTVPAPCGPFTGSGTDYSACEISLNSNLSPGILTADVLVGNPGVGDVLPPTPAAGGATSGNL